MFTLVLLEGTVLWNCLSNALTMCSTFFLLACANPLLVVELLLLSLWPETALNWMESRGTRLPR